MNHWQFSEKGSLVVYVTTPSQKAAEEMARLLVEERLAAGVSISSVRSIYSWEGEIKDKPESLLIIRTRQELFEKLKARVLELHEYVCPEVIGLPIVAGHAPYLQWIKQVTS